MNKKLLAASVAACLSVAALAGAPMAQAATSTLNLGVIIDVTDWQASSAQLANAGPYYQAVYSTLLNQDANANVLPGLAKSWSYDKTGTVLTLSLNKGIKYTDGEPFNAASVVANLNAFKKGASPSANMANGIVSVVAKTPTTVVITLDNIDSAFLTNLSGTMGFMQATNTIGGTDAKSNPIGAGPYIYDKASSVSGSSYVFKPNPAYYDKAHRAYDNLNIKVLNTSVAAINAIKAGQVDAVAIADNSAVAGLQAAGLTVDEQNLNWVGLTFVDKGGRMGTPLKKLAVRQAINYGFDRDAALKIMGLGYGKTIEQVFAPYNAGYDATLNNTYPYDLAKAKQMLSDAGYPNGFTLNMPTNPALASYVYDFMKDQFAKMGITINYTATTGSADFFAQVWAAKWPLYRMALQRDPNSWSLVQFLYARDAAWNPSGYGDATTDALIEKIRVATGKTQTALLKQLNTYTVQQAWFCPLYAPPVFFAHTSSVKVTTHAGNSMPFLSDFKK